MRRREFLKIAGAGAAGGVLLHAATMASPPSIPPLAVLADRVFLGPGDPAFLDAMRSPSVEFVRCYFLGCGTLRFGSGRMLTMRDCNIRDTRLVLDRAKFNIYGCHISYCRPLGKGEAVLHLYPEESDTDSRIWLSSMYIDTHEPDARPYGGRLNGGWSTTGGGAALPVPRRASVSRGSSGGRPGG